MQKNVIAVLKLILGVLGLAYVGFFLTVTLPSMRQIHELMNADFNSVSYYIFALFLSAISGLLLWAGWVSLRHQT